MFSDIYIAAQIYPLYITLIVGKHAHISHDTNIFLFFFKYYLFLNNQSFTDKKSMMLTTLLIDRKFCLIQVFETRLRHAYLWQYNWQQLFKSLFILT